MRLSLPTLVLGLFLAAPPMNGLAAQDPWKELAAGGARATRIQERLRKEGAQALLELLIQGLALEDPQLRSFAARLLPVELLREADLARLFTVLLESWEREDQAIPLSEDVQDAFNDLVFEGFGGLDLASLSRVTGWSDQKRLIEALKGPSKTPAAWAASGKKGRELRARLAQQLYPVTDSRAGELAARAILDPAWDPQERAPISWIVFPARDGAAYPGDEITHARLKSLLADRPDKSPRGLPLARVAQVQRAYPYLTAHIEALGPIRTTLIEEKTGANLDLLWAAARVLLARAPKEEQNRFWTAGLEPIQRFLESYQDPEARITMFLWVAPALGGWEGRSKVPQELRPLMHRHLSVPLEVAARKGQLTNDLFVFLLRLGDERLLARVLEAAPVEDIDALLEYPEWLLDSVDPGLVALLARSPSRVVARVAEAAKQLLDDRPEGQPDAVLTRLVSTPDPARVDLLAELYRRGLPLEGQASASWWKSLVAEDNPGAVPLARAHPERFRAYLASLSSTPGRLQEALAWCARHQVPEPFRTPLPEALQNILGALPGPEADPELPGIVRTIAPWLAKSDRQVLAKNWLKCWSTNPLALDSGSAARDLDVLLALFEGEEQALEQTFVNLLKTHSPERVAETCLGALVRIGHPPGPEAIEPLLDAGLIPSPFMALHACPIRPLLPKIRQALEPMGNDSWHLFLEICWGAWMGPGPNPSLPRTSKPTSDWWELATGGRFLEIFLAKAERANDHAKAPDRMTVALRGIALSARTEDEKARARVVLLPYLQEPHRGHYWTAVLAASFLGDPLAQKAREEAIAAGRSFFFHDHLLPWASLERSRELADLLLERGLPASGLIRSDLPSVLGTLIPKLDPIHVDQDLTWARFAQRWRGSGHEKTWDPVSRAWKASP